MASLDKIRWADSGDLATWVGSVSTALAIVGAGWAAWTAKKTFDIESRRNVEELQSQHRRHAEHISAWIEDQSDDVSRLVIHNGSDEPVYQVHIVIRESSDERPLIREQFDVVAPGNKIVHNSEIEGSTGPRHFRLEMRFTDSAGQRWKRSRYGALSDIGHQATIMAGPDFASALADIANDLKDAYGAEVECIPGLDSERLHQELIDKGAPSRVDAIVVPNDWLIDLHRNGHIGLVALPARYQEILHRGTLETVAFEDLALGIPPSCPR